MSNRPEPGTMHKYCLMCQETVDEEHYTVTDDNYLHIKFCPDCNIVTVKDTAWGNFARMAAGETYDDVAPKLVERYPELSGQTADDPFVTMPDDDAETVTYMERSAAQELGVDEYEAMQNDDSVRIVPDGSQTDEQDTDTEEEAHPFNTMDAELSEAESESPVEHPETIEEVREMAPEVFEQHEPDEETKLYVNEKPDEYEPDYSWMAFPPEE